MVNREYHKPGGYRVAWNPKSMQPLLYFFVEVSEVLHMATRICADVVYLIPSSVGVITWPYLSTV